MRNTTKNLYKDTTKRDKAIGALVIAGIVFMLSVLFIFAIPPVSSAFCDKFIPTVEAQDNITKEVTEACESMIDSYNSDKLLYEKFKNANSPEKFQWAQDAKNRANATAEFYNEYFTKYSYVWDNNVPVNICETLPVIE